MVISSSLAPCCLLQTNSEITEDVRGKIMATTTSAGGFKEVSYGALPETSSLPPSDPTPPHPTPPHANKAPTISPFSPPPRHTRDAMHTHALVLLCP
jgi:hypothetical protein